MTPALRQLRDGIKAHIAEDPSVVIPMRCPLIDNGFGGTTPSGTAVAQPAARIRIPHESGSVQRDQETPAGLGTSLTLYALTDYTAPLEAGDTFTIGGYVYVVGAVNVFARHGGVYKTEAPLTRTIAPPVTIPLSLTAAADSDTEIDLAWLDTGAVNTYSIERKTGSAAFAVIGTAAAGARTFSDSGLTAETAYTYRIRAYSGTTPSAYSTEATATTEEVPS